MFNNLQVLGIGIIGFAIIVGVGVVVLQKFSEGVAGCGTGYTYNENASGYEFTVNRCCADDTADCGTVGTNSTPASSGATTTSYLNTQMGTTGLAGWTPAIVALSVGLLFLGAFMLKRRKY